jgi:hypothetical protein
MKPVRFRTTILTVVVVGGSAVAGVGLGRFLTKVVHARQAANVAAADAQPPASVAERAAAMGLRKLPDYPLNLPSRQIKPRGFAASMPVKPLPTWNFTVTASAALGGGTFTGTILGRSPFLRGKTATTIPVQIVPLIITINDGTTTVTYDPTTNDPCVTPGNPTDVAIITQSPIFTNNPFTMNGVNVGTTQYIDAYQRAQFWSLVGGSNFHLLMSQTVLPAQTLNVTVANSSGPIQNVDATTFGGCGFLGIMQIDDLDTAVLNLMAGPLAGTINPGTFPLFLTKSVVSAVGSLNNCCVLGFHSATPSGGFIQIYSPLTVDTTGAFGGGFTDTISHEIAEAVDDPFVNNATPPWGQVGQTVGFCQNNLENGDPLSEGFGTPTKPFSVNAANGLTYSLQELAFFDWFFGTPSKGTGGKFSNNGSFCGPAILCPPGSTTFCP